MAALVGAIRGAVGAAVGAARAIAAGVRGVFAGAAGWLVAAGRAVIQGFINGIEGAAGALYGKLQSVIDKAKSLWSGATGWLHHSPSQWMVDSGKKVMAGFAQGIEQGTPQAEAAMRAAMKRAMDAAKAQASSAASSLQGLLQKAFSAKLGAEQTPAEKALADLQAAHDDAARQQALADAQTQLNAATTDDERLAAQRAYNDAAYAIQVAALEQQAATERTELEGQQTLRQAAFDKSLASLTTYLSSAHATAKGARTRINQVMKQYGLDMTTLGNLLGPSLAAGIAKSTDKAVAAAKKMAQAVYNAIKAELKISSPSKVMEEAGRNVALGFARGIERNAGAARLAMGALGSSTAGGMALLEATAGPVEVHVYLGSQELRGMVRTEIVDSNTGLARRLLAGGRP
jgi:hypothetical protein